jgi:hypothetical protein
MEIVTQLKSAIQSLRLRLHSGLRQSCRAFGPVVYGTAEACPFEVLVVRGTGAVALSRDAHVPPPRTKNVRRGPRLSDDEAVAKMGHPDVGHPPPERLGERCLL